MGYRPGLATALYNAAWALALPAVFARFWWRGRREPTYRQAWAQRLGSWPDLAPPAEGRPRLWVHAVSLGETRAAVPLIQALRQLVPGMQLLLTTATATGHAAGSDLLQPGDLHGWIPLDTPGATAEFLAHTRPAVGVLMETETWPNLLQQAQHAGVPMVLANARLSERSLRKGLRWASLTQPMMGRLAAVCAQTVDDARRLALAGAPTAHTTVTGNLKFDLQPDPALLARGRQWLAHDGAYGGAHADANGGAHEGAHEAAHQATSAVWVTSCDAVVHRRVVMAASWREGEDAALLQAWREQVRPGGDRPRLLLVPRHPQRFDEVHATMLAAGLTVSRRSQWPAEGLDRAALEADAWLGDSIGEMPAYYAAADVALLGGSFAPLGGQNLIEAAACGCPVVMGPHTFNFQEAAQQALEEGAAWRMPQVAQALSLALSLTGEQLQRGRAASRAFSARHAGAAKRQAAVVAALLAGSEA